MNSIPCEYQRTNSSNFYIHVLQAPIWNCLFFFFFFFLRNVKNVHSSVLTETSFEEVLFLKHWNQLKSSSNIFRSLCTVLTFEQYQQHISIVSHTLRDVHFTSTHMYACFTRCYIPKLTFFRTIIGARNCQPTSNRKKTHRWSSRSRAVTCCLNRKHLGIATRASTAVSLGALPPDTLRPLTDVWLVVGRFCTRCTWHGANTRR